MPAHRTPSSSVPLASLAQSWRKTWQKLAPASMDVFLLHRLVMLVLPVAALFETGHTALRPWLVLPCTLLLFFGALYLGKLLHLSPSLAWFMLGVRMPKKKPSFSSDVRVCELSFPQKR